MGPATSKAPATPDSPPEMSSVVQMAAREEKPA